MNATCVIKRFNIMIKNHHIFDEINKTWYGVYINGILDFKLYKFINKNKSKRRNNLSIMVHFQNVNKVNDFLNKLMLT